MNGQLNIELDVNVKQFFGVNMANVTVRTKYLGRPVDISMLLVYLDGLLVSYLPTGIRGVYLSVFPVNRGVHQIEVRATYYGYVAQVKRKFVVGSPTSQDVSIYLTRNNDGSSTLEVRVWGETVRPDRISVTCEGRPIPFHELGEGRFLLPKARFNTVEVEACVGAMCKKTSFLPPLPPLNSWDPKIWIGRRLYGYEVVDYLGQGGFGYVLRGRANAQDFALKIPRLSNPGGRSNTLNSLEVLEGLFKEGRALVELSGESPYLVKLEGLHVDRVLVKNAVSDPSYYLELPPVIVMEFMEGGPLSKLVMDDILFYSRKWTDVVLLVGQRTASALYKVHQRGYVHCDVKPSNVLLDKPSPTTAEELLEDMKRLRINPKLADLGSATREGGTPPGVTVEHSSLEHVVALNRGGISWRDDIYSLGSTLLFLLTRRYINGRLIDKINSALDSRDLRDLTRYYHLRDLRVLDQADVSKEVRIFLSRMISSEPRERPTALETFNFFSSVISSGNTH